LIKLLIVWGPGNYSFDTVESRLIELFKKIVARKNMWKDLIN